MAQGATGRERHSPSTRLPSRGETSTILPQKGRRQDALFAGDEDELSPCDKVGTNPSRMCTCEKWGEGGTPAANVMGIRICAASTKLGRPETVRPARKSIAYSG